MDSNGLEPGIEDAVRASFSRQAFMNTLGARLTNVAAGRVEIELEPDARLTQQHGYLHAGVVTSIADSAAGYAAYTAMPPGSDVLSVEFKINLLAPAAGERFIARARVVRSGRTLTIVQSDVYAMNRAGERHIATMMGTMMRIAPRPEETAGR